MADLAAVGAEAYPVAEGTTMARGRPHNVSCCGRIAGVAEPPFSSKEVEAIRRQIAAEFAAVAAAFADAALEVVEVVAAKRPRRSRRQRLQRRLMVASRAAKRRSRRLRRR